MKIELFLFNHVSFGTLIDSLKLVFFTEGLKFVNASTQINSFGMRIGFLNDPLFAEYDPTQWVSVSREVILHFLKNRVSTTKCLFSCLQHKDIKKHSKDEI